MRTEELVLKQQHICLFCIPTGDFLAGSPLFLITPGFAAYKRHSVNQ